PRLSADLHRAHRAGQHVGEGLVVGFLEMELDGEVVDDLDLVEVAQQVAVALRPHGRGAVVVGGGGVQGGDLVGGADGHGPAATVAVTGAAAVLGGLGAGGQQ